MAERALRANKNTARRPNVETLGHFSFTHCLSSPPKPSERGDHRLVARAAAGRAWQEERRRHHVTAHRRTRAIVEPSRGGPLAGIPSRSILG
jgi:hypothetical protein